jgi:peptidyl-prolyl cis-trans isomerase B (cyclophilin B)
VSGARRNRSLLAAPLTLLLALALVAAGCGGGGDDSTAAEAGDCQDVEVPPVKEAKADPPTADAPTAKGVTFDTNCGSFTITFDERSPKTAASFQSLVEQGYYDGLTIHRAITDRLIQGGDPLGADPDKAGTGDPGYSVDEKPPPGLAYTEGTVAMAKTELEPPGRSGSQFFIAVAPDLGLTPDYALVGKVTEGFDVVKAISELAPDGADGPPTTPVVIEKATVEG